jgi:hypothetical protein
VPRRSAARCALRARALPASAASACRTLGSLRLPSGLYFSPSCTWSCARVPWASRAFTAPLNKRTISCRSMFNGDGESFAFAVHSLPLTPVSPSLPRSLPLPSVEEVDKTANKLRAPLPGAIEGPPCLRLGKQARFRASHHHAAVCFFFFTTSTMTSMLWMI